MGTCNSNANKVAGGTKVTIQPLPPDGLPATVKLPPSKESSPVATPQLLTRHLSQRSMNKLLAKDAKRFAGETCFTPDEVTALHDTYFKISSIQDDDGLINLEEFRRAVGHGSYFIDRMFTIIDKDKNGTIDFNEYLQAMSAFSERASVLQKTRFCFDVYNASGSGYISKSEVREMLQASLKDRGLSLDPSELDSLVDKTFESMGITEQSRGIDFQTFSEMVKRYPTVISNMTITVPVRQRATK